MDTLTLIGLLALLEVIFVVTAVAITLIFKLRSARRELLSLRQKLDESAVVAARAEVPARSGSEVNAPLAEYADFLREQLGRSNLLLGEDVQVEPLQEADQTDVATQDRQMLAARHQFLQLELDQQNTPQDDEPAQQRKRLINGMRALLNAMGWQTQATGEADVSVADNTSTATQSSSRGEVIRLEEQIASLRRVIDNQHDSMRNLRELLEAQAGDDESSSELQAALKKLRNAEAQSVELYRCMEVVESENDRLKKRSKSSGMEGDGTKQDAESLRDLVDDQQRTIGSLQELLRSVKSGTDNSSELDAAFNKIQRTNNELNSCIMLLEEENDMLRTTAENLQARFDQQEAAAVAAVATSVAAVAIAAEEVEAATVEVSTESESGAADTARDDADFDIDALLESTPKPAVAPAVVPSTEAEPAAADENTDVDIDALLESTQKPAPAEPVELNAELATPAAEADADFDIDALLESTPKSASPPAAEPGAEAKPAAVEEEAEVDIDALLEATQKPATAKPVEPSAEAPAADDDIDALLESFGQGAAPAPRATKPASVEDDTDALLAELFGNKPK